MSYPPQSAGISGPVAGLPAPRLFDEVHRHMRVKHYSLRTEKIYIGWMRRFILANAKRHPRDMGSAEVEAFLSLLAVKGKVAASTQNQALSALLFLYRVVLGIELPWMEGVVRAKRPKRVPTVLSQGEVRCLLAHMEGRPQLLASLLYGTGMRLMECLRLRVKDVDFARSEITIRGGKGAKDRRTVLPKSLVEPLQREIERARTLHTPPTWSQGLDRQRCPMRWRANIRRQHATLVGNTCSRPYSARSIQMMASSGAITSTTPCWRVD